VIAFTDGVEYQSETGNTGQISIHTNNATPGVVVDGQQRLSALAKLPDKDFEVFVTGIYCKNSEELRKQFILINNSKPRPQALIYELLPTVEGLPQRLSSRSTAALLIEKLNYKPESSLKGQIKQHTNPTGVLQDTVMQKLMMSSLSDGILRNLIREENGVDISMRLISEFFAAVQTVFSEDWEGRKPRTSRLVHGTGITSMGYVMEHLCSSEAARSREDFEKGLQHLKGKTAWTSGTWQYGEDNIRPWNSLQCVPRDYMELSNFLVRLVRLGQRQKAGNLSLVTETG
jgi:DGQHR domain-containing protein